MLLLLLLFNLDSLSSVVCTYCKCPGPCFWLCCSLVIEVIPWGNNTALVAQWANGCTVVLSAAAARCCVIWFPLFNYPLELITEIQLLQMRAEPICSYSLNPFRVEPAAAESRSSPWIPPLILECCIVSKRTSSGILPEGSESLLHFVCWAAFHRSFGGILSMSSRIQDWRRVAECCCSSSSSPSTSDSLSQPFAQFYFAISQHEPDIHSSTLGPLFFCFF